MCRKTVFSTAGHGSRNGGVLLCMSGARRNSLNYEDDTTTLRFPPAHIRKLHAQLVSPIERSLLLRPKRGALISVKKSLLERLTLLLWELCDPQTDMHMIRCATRTLTKSRPNFYRPTNNNNAPTRPRSGRCEAPSSHCSRGTAGTALDLGIGT